MEVQHSEPEFHDTSPLIGGSERTKAEKIAILLAALENSIAVDLLKKLEPDDVKQIVESSGRLGPITNKDVEPLVEEFEGECSETLGITAGSGQILSLMELAFTSDQVARMMGREVVNESDSVWAKFTVESDKTLVPYLLDEGEQTAAVVLSKIAPEVAARCIALFPRGPGTKIVSRMLSLGDISALPLASLEAALQEDFFAKSKAQEKGPKLDRMAAVVNKLDRQHSTDLLEDLAKINPEDYKSLRKMVFMFEDIQRLDQKYRMKLFDRVPTEQVIPALFAMDAGFRDLVLSSMGARARRMVESELQGDTSAPHKDTMAARRKIADIAIQMSRKGDIELPEMDVVEPSPEST
jgi:flagellar motor switch protein FliG